MSSHSELWPRDAIRKEFMLAARKISRGDQVLDVGCGIASFRHAIPHASYVGIDPHFGKNHTEDNIHAQTLGEHLALHAGAYDAVCAFEVLEHLSTPGAMFADMMRAVRPGGLVIVGVPHLPSAFTRSAAPSSGMVD